jgi:hypothetical protein
MSILELRILPPLAIARLGSSANPLENFTLKIPEGGLDFREIEPAETLYVDEKTGKIANADTPKVIRFKDVDQVKDIHRIRPVAPFLEVFARTAADTLEPLTIDLLRAHGLKPSDVRWTVEVGNIKAYRRTGDERDKAVAKVSFCDHAVYPLEATAEHFLPRKVLPLGKVRYIQPNTKFPEIRLRFTPAAGLVYGASDRRLKKIDDKGKPIEFEDREDIVIEGRVIYDGKRDTQKWLGWIDQNVPNTTNPGQIYAGYINEDGNQVSWGYLDDECDGFVTVELACEGQELTAFARIGAGPPAFAPDGLPIRTVHDELVQAWLGPAVQPADVSASEAEDTVRRALETVRLMNTAVMNGNTVAGRTAVASMMPSQDSNDTHRLFAPVMAPSIVDTLSVLALHQGVLTALRAGTAPWFVDALRKPEEIGDLSDAGRRKMPAMMRGADGRYLTLTRRQIDMIRQVSAAAPFKASSMGPPLATPANGITAKNVTAQLAYLGRSNPPLTHPISAISNCFPGLEFDFRNIWRRIFVGIVLTEHTNYVTEFEDETYKNLKGRRLLAIDGVPVMQQATGPAIPSRGPVPLPVDGNPEAVAFMEWSNTIARLWDKQGQKVSCLFTEDEPATEILVDDKGKASVKTKAWQLEVRQIFEQVLVDGRPEPHAVIARVLAQPGELTQGLCSPWQNDYRECACYYWAASRPDYVNVVPTDDGTSRGDMWLQKVRTGDYLLDDRTDVRLATYDDLFRKWEKVLQFQIRGKDAVEAGRKPTGSDSVRNGKT